MKSNFDVLVVGVGPAGTSLAIICAKGGLDVCIIEAKTFPRYHIGESVHPGLEPLFYQLGIADAINHVNFLRHDGNWIKWDSELVFSAFGQTNDQTKKEIWKGFQLWRSDFDNLLLNHAKEMGGKIIQPCQAFRPLTDKNLKVCGVFTSHGTKYSSYVVDAAGSQNWLAKSLGLKIEKFSPPLLCYYGYAQGKIANSDKTPLLIADDKDGHGLQR